MNLPAANPRKDRAAAIAEGLKGRDFLVLADFTAAELAHLLDLAAQLKALQKEGRPFAPLAGKTLAMIFEKPSTRTRVSFEVGMAQLGGQALFLSRSDLQLGRGETIGDTARVLSRYVDAIMIRAYSHRHVVELARAATVPVINGLTDFAHPCQALADLLTLREAFGRLKGLKLAYVGDGNNVAHSLIVGAAKMGLDVAVATPEQYAPHPAVMETARACAAEAGGSVTWTTDPAAAVSGAHAVYTDVWASMGQEDEAEARKAIFAPYQVNADLMAKADPQAVFLHCLPAHRGEEVTDEVIDGPQSVVFDQAENRLHVQKAILVALLGA
ncbi:ornithine carbamoyltransferase [Calditerricola satsumensis]|uniref:Ornithine carbamoyltransferase n=2 Tax=Calditerricola satsumensis TaxID=373054 RepID=A0A8J3BB58_9BACI|nr:ornithine carbamoyltransferase [Calditerricola satsumensis]GGJ94699.1 ornithine carbamoyltransferase [Calditerricola satsumensis]